jgi:hypothetical protein
VGGRVGETSPTQAQQLLQRIKDYISFIDGQVEKETQAWIADFQSNIAEIEKTAKTLGEAARPGAIDITVSNGKDADDGITISLDGLILEKVFGAKYQIGYAPPGPHKIAVSAKFAGVTVETSELISVSAGAIAKVTLTLPTSIRT